ncbi:MAG: hydrogenase nickel incorporation protein HypA [Verrucomicrobiota bacterium]
MPGLASLYVVLGLGLIFVFWMWSDFQDRRRQRERSENTVFHCIHCEHLYLEPRIKEVARCPRCGRDNLRLRF